MSLQCGVVQRCLSATPATDSRDFSSDVQSAIPFESYLHQVESVIGRRVRIRAVKEVGSERLLDGLTGRVVELHPIAHKWVKVELDPNPITPHRIWSVPVERLVFSRPSFDS